jgi:hypothetical protein
VLGGRRHPRLKRRTAVGPCARSGKGVGFPLPAVVLAAWGTPRLHAPAAAYSGGSMPRPKPGRVQLGSVDGLLPFLGLQLSLLWRL